MNAHSMDLRERVAAAIDRKEGSQRQIARRFAISLSFVERLSKHRRETGEPGTNRARVHRPYALDAADRIRLRELVEEHLDATLQEYVAMGRFHCNPATLWRTLRRMGLTRKRKTLHAAERDRPDVKAKRAHYRATARMTDAKRLGFPGRDRAVHIDDDGLRLGSARGAGRGSRADRVEYDDPGGGDQPEGVAGSMTLPGATTYETLGTFVRDVLAPSLHAGTLVVADNLKAHDSVEAVEALRKVGAKSWHLPPYSSDNNPIEEMWSKVKQRVRRSGARAREDLYRAITEALQCVTSFATRDCMRSLSKLR